RWSGPPRSRMARRKPPCSRMQIVDRRPNVTKFDERPLAKLLVFRHRLAPTERFVKPARRRIRFDHPKTGARKTVLREALGHRAHEFESEPLTLGRLYNVDGKDLAVRTELRFASRPAHTEPDDTL